TQMDSYPLSVSGYDPQKWREKIEIDNHTSIFIGPMPLTSGERVDSEGGSCSKVSICPMAKEKTQLDR
ncbi:hypothetical protein PILCRDRAFT_826366, partial [Piloderma croceum F 1598]